MNLKVSRPFNLIFNLQLSRVMSERIVVDPLTRIEGHLRIEADIENGKIKDAYSSGTMVRGIETIVKDRDPRDAWVFVGRVCGVCTSIHSLCSVRAVENAFDIVIPPNAEMVRNIMTAVLYMHDHVVHFYQLHALDWVDVVSALKADPTEASLLAQKLSPWPKSSTGYFTALKERLNKFVGSGQLGIFANGYWGHPAYKLTPEQNLIAVAHYLEALEWQKEIVKVHAVFGYRKGEAISGVYEEKTHNIVPVETCMIEDKKADEIIGTIRGMLKSFKIHTYDEDTGYGLLRHALIRRGFTSGQIMVVLVTASPVFPSKNNFVKALRQKHPEITTIVQNINNRGTSMVLGDKEHVLYGKGFIEDELCGCKFRISPKSFYQVNPVQTEYLYGKAIELADLTGNERVLDAYCGIGTIGIIAASKAKEVIGVELNADAVRDAIQNAKCNDVKNIRFFCNDATEFMMQMAASGDTVDVVLMDPPRAGSTEAFIKAVAAVKAKTVIYVSCGPDTLARDLGVFKKMGYQAEGAWPVDMFPATGHCENVVRLNRVK